MKFPPSWCLRVVEFILRESAGRELASNYVCRRSHACMCVPLPEWVCLQVQEACRPISKEICGRTPLEFSLGCIVWRRAYYRGAPPPNLIRRPFCVLFMRRRPPARVCSRVLKDIIIWARMSHYTRVSADMAAYKSSALPHDKVTHFPPGPDAAWILTQRLQLLLPPPAWLALRFLHVAVTAQVGAAFLRSAYFVIRDKRSSGCFSLFSSSL